MGEKRKLSEKTIASEGFFKTKEVLDIIKDWMKENSYTPVEVEIKEVSHEGGKDTNYKFAPYKKINDYVKYVVKISVKIFNCKDITVKKKTNGSYRCQEGNVKVKIEKYIETDYEKRFEDRPFKLFVRTLLDKFMIKDPMDDWTAQLDKEVTRLEALLKGYFKIHNLE